MCEKEKGGGDVTFRVRGGVECCIFNCVLMERRWEERETSFEDRSAMLRRFNAANGDAIALGFFNSFLRVQSLPSR